MKKQIGIAVGLVIVVVGILLIVKGNSEYKAVPTATPVPVSTETPLPSGTKAPTPAPTASGEKSYTLAQVSTHKDSSSCWSTINGKVYDLTSWIGQHPGGQEAILSICGKDGSAAFNDQHGGQRRPADELKNFYIGVLVK